MRGLHFIIGCFELTHFENPVPGLWCPKHRLKTDKLTDLLANQTPIAHGRQNGVTQSPKRLDKKKNYQPLLVLQKPPRVPKKAGDSQSPSVPRIRFFDMWAILQDCNANDVNSGESDSARAVFTF